MADAAPSARVRIGRVTLKRGGSVELLHLPVDEMRGDILARVRRMLDSYEKDIAGCALVMWSHNLDSSAAMMVGGTSTIPTILVPDFVRNRLLAERIERWTLDTIFDPPRAS